MTNNITKSPANFRAFREMCGLSQQLAAESLNVSLATIEEWESGEREIPDDAMKWAIDSYADHCTMVDDAVDRVESVANEGDVVAIEYCRDQEQANLLAETEKKEALPHQFRNSVSRSVAEILLDLGYLPVFTYPDEERIYGARI